MWANAYLSYSQPPLYYILQETLCVRGRIATQIVLQNILKFAHGYNLCVCYYGEAGTFLILEKTTNWIADFEVTKHRPEH